MIARFTVQLLCTLFTAGAVFAGTWHSLDDGKEGFLFFTGPIREGDSRELARAYIARSDIKTVILESPGGDLIEGIRLAETIERLALTTVVLKGRPCESACALAFMGGLRRVAGAGATLGIHAPYRIQDASPHAFLDAEGVVIRDFRNLHFRRVVTEFAARKGITREFVDLMFLYDDPRTTKSIDAQDGLRMGVFTHVMP